MLRLAALLALGISTIAHTQPTPAQPARQAAGSSLRAEDHRLASIAYRLALAGAGLCGEPAPLTGLLLHHLAEYDAEGRRLTLAAWPMLQGPGILSVVDGSPAAQARLAAGDVLLLVNALPFRSPAEIAAIANDKARRQAIEQAEALLEDQLRLGPAQITVLREGERREVALTARPACPARVRLARSNQPNAFANGRYAVVTTAVMAFTQRDDELAIVLAHELAHNILGHKARLEAQRVPRGLLRRFGKNAARIYATEQEADRLAVRLVAAAGYDTGAIIPFWRRFYARYDSPQLFRTHPGLKARERLIEQALSELTRSDLRAQRP